MRLLDIVSISYVSISIFKSYHVISQAWKLAQNVIGEISAVCSATAEQK